ncbi:MAG: cytochrome b [Acetobacteraceae bacterium]
MAYRYPTVARWLHWLTAVLVLGMIVLGFWITWYEPKDETFKQLLYNIHESTGVVVFVIVLLRLLRRLANPPAPLPRNMPGAMRFAAHANHALLYALLLLQPVIGFLDTNAWGYPLVWAGLVPIPSPVGESEALGQIMSALHWYGGVALVVLIAAHVAGAFYHGVIRRDGVVQRML